MMTVVKNLAMFFLLMMLYPTNISGKESYRDLSVQASSLSSCVNVLVHIVKELEVKQNEETNEVVLAEESLDDFISLLNNVSDFITEEKNLETDSEEYRLLYKTFNKNISEINPDIEIVDPYPSSVAPTIISIEVK